jgi:hypothetical protein
MAGRMSPAALGIAVAVLPVLFAACAGSVPADRVRFHGQVWRIGVGGDVELSAQASIASYVYTPVGSLQDAAPIATAHSSVGGVYSLTTDAAHSDQRIVFADDQTGASVEVILTGLTPGANVTVSPTTPAAGSVQVPAVDASRSGEYDTANVHIYVPPPVTQP